MSEYRWNNRFNPPLETASINFPKRVTDLPTTPANSTTHQMYGGPFVPVYTNPITYVPPISITTLDVCSAQLTVTMTLSFDYRMSGTDHVEFTFTNSNTDVATTKSFQPATTYTVGEFDPGVTYFVYVTPYINGLYTAPGYYTSLSATSFFLSSFATAPGILQGLRLTGSGSFARISYTGVYPANILNQIAVDDNFGNPQILIPVASTSGTIVIGPYTNGLAYQFQLAPVTGTAGQILRYGNPIPVPAGSFFIPGPPGTPNVMTFSVSGANLDFTVQADTTVHPEPVSYLATTYESSLFLTLPSITGPLDSITDLPYDYCGFSVSTGLITPSNFSVLSSGVAACNLVADITDNETGLWYSFRVTSATSNNDEGGYIFTNSNLLKANLLYNQGGPYTVNFSNVTLETEISSYPFVDPITTISNINNLVKFTTVLIKSFANNIYTTPDEYEYLTVFVGPPFTPTNVLNEIGNQTFRWTVGSNGGPRPTLYNFYLGNTQTTLLARSTSVVGTISGLTNLTTYTFNVIAYANGLSSAPLTIAGIVPDFVSPTSLTVTSICDTTVNLAVGRPLGGALGYLVQAISGASTVIASRNISDEVNPTATFVSGTLSSGFAYSFRVFSQDTGNPPPSGFNVNLSAATPTSYFLGPPRQTTNIQGSYAGITNASGATPTALFTLTSTWPGGVPVTEYLISNSYLGSTWTASSEANYNLNYSFDVSSYAIHRFTVSPFGNNLFGLSAQSASFDLNPQPPTSALLVFSGIQGLTLTVTFTGSAYTSPNDFYTIVPLLTQNISGQIQSSPFQNSTAVTSGFAYQFSVFSTICGIVSLTGRTTNAAFSGPPAPPLVTFTLGRNQINFTLQGDPCNNVVISNYQITEFFSNISSGYVRTALPPVVVSVTPSAVPTTVTSTLSGNTTLRTNRVRLTGQWSESNSIFPTFSSIGVTETDALLLNTYSNLVTLSVGLGTTTLAFPVTTYSSNSPNTYRYGTNIVVKPSNPLFDPSESLIFTWTSGTGPFIGGNYRYDIVSLGYSVGATTLTSITPNSQFINFYVPVPGTPSLSVSNTTATVSPSASINTTVIPQYYIVTDNFGRSVSGATTLSSFVFSGLTAGQTYSYTVTGFSNGIQSVSSLPVIAYPGVPGPPGISNFETSFVRVANGTATATFNTFVGTTPFFVPLTDICLTVVQGTAGYSISKTNISNLYTSNGPTYTLTNLSAGSTYIFTLSAYGNQLYSTLSSVYNLFIGSIPPNGSPSVFLYDTEASITVSAANVTSRLGAVNPTSYVFTSTLCGSGIIYSEEAVYTEGNTEYSRPFSDLIALSNYSFTVFTITNGFCGNVIQAGVFNMGGPRDALFSLSSVTLPAGNPTTVNVSLQIIIRTGYTPAPGLWPDTAYFFKAVSQFSNYSAAAEVATTSNWTTVVTLTSPVSGNVKITLAGARGGNNAEGVIGGDGGIVRYTYSNIIAGQQLTFRLGIGANFSPSYGYSSLVTLPDGIQIEAGAGGGAAYSTFDPNTGMTENFPGNPGQSLTHPGFGGAGGSTFFGGNGGPGNGGAWDPSLNQVITLPGLIVTQGGNSNFNGYVSLDFLATVIPPTRMTSNIFTGSVLTGYSYEIDIYGIKNQVQGISLSASIVVPPALPISPTITVNPQTPPLLNIEIGTAIPATVSWTPSPTVGAEYYYFINSSAGGLTYTGILTADQITLPFGSSARLFVQALANSVSSTFAPSAVTLVSTNPPTNLTFTRTSNIVTLSWGSAYQPPYFIPGTTSNFNYVFNVSTATNAGVNSVYISSAGGGPAVTFGSNLMTPAIYAQIVDSIGSNEPVFVNLSGTAYNHTFQVNAFNTEVAGSQIIGYLMSNTTLASLPSYSGASLRATITNPSSLPTGGYTIWDTCGGAIIASNIYSNTYTWTGGVLGQRYNLAVQALNSNLYSPTASASAGFILATTPVSLLSVSNIGSTVTLSWTTPLQDDGVRPTTNPPYSWTIFDQSGSLVTTGSTLSTSTFGTTLGRTYTYSIVVSYYGISSTPTVGNPISLFTNPPTSPTQTTFGQGIVLSWGAAMQTVYFPAAPTVATSQFPNGGYSITDLTGNYGSVLTASSNLTELYIPITAPPYRSYNFAITALHNSICSAQVAPGAVFLGVNSVTDLRVTTIGNLATLRWLPAVSNGPNSPYIIYDANGNQIGDPSTSFVRTLTYSTPGIYSVTTLESELVSVYAYGAGGSVGAGGFASNTYSVNSNTTIIINVGQAGAGGGNSTVYVPNPANPYLILDAGGGGGFTVSGEGFIRNGGVSDGGGPGLPGFGSGGQASLGGGSPPGVDGQVVITLTTQTLSAALSVGTGVTSITFPIINNTNYALTVASYSNGLVATTSVSLNTIISSPSNLTTTNDGLYLSNVWSNPATQPTGYLLTNLTTGTFNTPGVVSSSVFTEPGVNGTSYRFSLIALSNGLPSKQIVSSPITLFCPPPSNFKSSYNGTTIAFTASGNPAFALETYTLTDGSGVVIQSGLPQFGVGTAASTVQITPVVRAAGSIYTFRLFGTINGLSSSFVTTSANLVIPGSTTLGTPPFILNISSSLLTGSNRINIYPCTPVGDTWRIAGTSLVRSYNQYTGVPGIQTWNSVAMSSNGDIIVASANDSVTGSNIWISLNDGLNWTGATNASGRAGYTASNVAIALNGTTAMVATTGGLWMSSNVLGSAPWSNITIPTGDIEAVAVSPDGSRIVYTPSSAGTVYYATMSGYPNLAFFGANGPASPITSTVFGGTQWASSGLAWSGDGTTIIAAAGNNPSGLMYISTNYGQAFSILPIYVQSDTSDYRPRSFTNVSVNSNATIILASYNPNSTAASNQLVRRYFYGQAGAYSNFWTETPTGSGNGLSVTPSIGSYKTITSFGGDIQIVCDSLSGSVFTSYDQGYSWYVVTVFQNSSGYQAAAVSSDGLTQIVLGSNTYLQTLINTPQPGASTNDYVANNAGQAVYQAPAGVDGYTITPLLKNIPGPPQYVWTTPTPGPSFYAQTTEGTANTTGPAYASGYSNYTGVTSAFLVINITSPVFASSQDFNISQISTYPAITSTKFSSNTASVTYVIQNTGFTTCNMSPGLYVFSVGASGGANTCNSPAEVYIPPPPPTAVTISGTSGGTQLSVTWTAPANTYFPSSVEYQVYSNGSFLSNTASTAATMANSGSPTLVEVRTLTVSFTSTFASATSAPPAPPANVAVTGYVYFDTVNLQWTSNVGTTYTISYGATIENNASSPADIGLLPGSNVTIGVTALSNGLLSTKSIVTCTNRIGTATAAGITTNVNLTTNFIITSMRIIGGGGAGGAGGWGGNAISTQGGGGGGQGGTLLFSGGQEPIQTPTVITLAAGKAGTAGTLGNGGGGGTGSTVSLGGNAVAYAAGGGGGGGGNGRAGGNGSGYAGGGTGGTGGAAGTNIGGGGGGGGGGQGTVVAFVGSYTSLSGSNGSSRAAPAGGEYSNFGGAGGGIGAGAQQDASGATGNFATVVGCAGGGGAGGVAFSTNPSNSARGGSAADGFVTISYVYLTG